MARQQRTVFVVGHAYTPPERRTCQGAHRGPFRLREDIRRWLEEATGGPVPTQVDCTWCCSTITLPAARTATVTRD